MKQYLFFLLGLFILNNVNAQTSTKPATSLQTAVESIAAYESLKYAPLSVYIVNTENGEILADYNGNMSIPSASTMKLVTTATASVLLGRAHRFKTTIAYSGTLDTLTGTLNGDLYLIGGGDPTLGSRYFNDEGHERDFLDVWADTLYKLGLRRVNGRLIADASIYKYDGAPSGWVWGDMGNYYGAGPSGLTIFDNMCKLHFETGPNAGDTAKLHCTDPFIPNFSIKNTVLADNGNSDNAYVFGAPYSNDWYVEGSIPKGREDFVVKASLPDPEYTFSIELDYALEQRGIHLLYAPTTNRFLQQEYSFKRPAHLTTLFEHESPYLGTIMDLVNHHSVNLFAEHVLCAISVYAYGYGSTYSGAQKCMNYWSGKVDANGLFMTDGSGLSRSNSVSAKFLVDMLTFMSTTSAYSGFKGTLAVAGKSGTMAGMCKGTTAYGRVYGKSGTMTRMKSYAGYVDCKSGKKLAFAMIANNYTCSTSKIRDYFESLMVKMANY